MSLRLVSLVLLAVVGLVTVSSTPADAHPSTLPAGFIRETVVQGLSAPTAFVFDGDQYLITEKFGVLQVGLPNGSLRAEPYITLNVSAESERGLLGIALHPEYPTKPFVYVYYTTGPGALDYSGTPENRVSRFRTVDGKGTNEKILLDHIPSDSGMHNAGDLQFGGDGMLYVSVGDGGVDTRTRADDLESLSGKILRLRPNGKIPEDNPYYNRHKPRKEIYAAGFRNPFRLNVRERDGEIFIGDVGWGAWEEVDRLFAKGDYGWPTFEGPCTIDTACDPTQTNFGATIPPYYYYDSAVEYGNAVVGGDFADGGYYPAPYNGGYFFGDFHGWVHVLRINRKYKIKETLDFDTDIVPIQFRTGPDNRMYVLDHISGELYRYDYAP